MIKSRHKKPQKESINEKYREILEMPDLTDDEIDRMREHMQMMARIICEYVWNKKVY